MPLNVDLSTVRAFENHRGIGYLLFLSSIAAPSLVAYSLIEPDAIALRLLPSAVTSAAVGLLATSACVLGSFLILFDGPGEGEGLEMAGTKSLVLGISLSFVCQCMALGYALLSPGPHSFGSYARTSMLFVGLTALCFFVMSFYKESAAKRGGEDS